MIFVGWWRIVEMELWDADAIDLVGPGFIEFDQDLGGRFRFIAVDGWMDFHEVERDGRPGVEFSWDGSDEGDDVSGRGWAVLADGGSIEGRIFFHRGDDSGFRATRAESQAGGSREEVPARTPARAGGRVPAISEVQISALR